MSTKMEVRFYINQYFGFEKYKSLFFKFVLVLTYFKISGINNQNGTIKGPVHNANNTGNQTFNYSK